MTITKQELEILKCKLELSEQALIVALEKRESDAAQITLWKTLAKKRGEQLKLAMTDSI
tara:strand:+ start:378 stop:554 length:177 start_codon:yes stop_codon:yes gene_type:complete